MAFKFFFILLSLISYAYCIGFNFTSVPEKFKPGELFNIEFFLLDNVNRTEYTINFHLCQLNNCNKVGSWKTFDERNYYRISALYNNDICYFSNKPTNDWLIKAEILINDNEELYFDSKKMNRELICENAQCIEKECQKSITRGTSQQLNELKNKNVNIFLILIVGISFIILLIAIIVSIYYKNFKNKEEELIPIFSIEDDFTCNEITLSTDKSVSVNKDLNSDEQKNSYNNAPKTVKNQNGLSVQLQLINSINDNSSQVSQNSQNKQNNLKIDTQSKASGQPNFGSISPISISSTLPVISEQKINKKISLRSNMSINNTNYKDHKNHYSPSLPAEAETKLNVSDIHAYHSNYVNNEKDSTKILSSKHYVLSTFEGDYEKEELNLHYGDIVSVINIFPDGWAYGELLMNYNAYDNNVYNDKVKSDIKGEQRKYGYYPIKCLSSDEETVEIMSEPSKSMKEVKYQDLKPNDVQTDDSNTYNYKNAKEMYEKEKAYQLDPYSLLSNNNNNLKANNSDDNDDNKESVISGKSHKSSITKNKNNDNSSNSINNNKNKYNSNDTISNDSHKDNSNDHHKNNGKRKNSENDKNGDNNNNRKKFIHIHKRSTSNTLNLRSSKRSSIFNLFKKASRDFSITHKEALHIYSEPGSNHIKHKSIETFLSVTDSSEETVYHDALQEKTVNEMEILPNNKNNSYISRLSASSFISFRSY